MVYRTELYIESAHSHLESRDRRRLLYACLDLRFALEQIAYQKLQLRLGNITVEEIGAWQPRRAIESLMELVDEHIGESSTIRVARETSDEGSQEKTYVMLGETKGVSPREIGKHWQKLGYFLHARMPKRKGDHPEPPDESVLRAYLEEVIKYLENITSTGFDLYFSPKVSFECSKCGQIIVRNHKLLNEGQVVQCQNEQCTASYLVHEKGGKFNFEFYEVAIGCKICAKTSYVEANTFFKMKTNEERIFVCPECKAAHVVKWKIYYATERDARKEDEDQA